jgi:hypothetical protein
LIGVAVGGPKSQLLAGAATELAVAGATLALATVAPTVSPALMTVAASMVA